MPKYHSIIISGKNSYEEWGLIPVERPVISPPAVKSNFIELPGSSESIDLTEMLRGRTVYGQRTGSWRFYFDPEWIGDGSSRTLSKKREGTLWLVVYTSLLNYTHGKTHVVSLEDVPDISYKGRLTLANWKSGNPFSEVTINYNLNPIAESE